MQRILGYMRKAIQEFDLIENGDRIAVGVSGGKDSLVLLKGLHLLKRFIGIDYELIAITLDPRFNKTDSDYSAIKSFCNEMEIPYYVKATDIGQIVFDIRKEPNPCSLCARMRRGALHDVAIEFNCNKIALGHHYDDVVETFMMNLFNEGRIGCFSPKSYLSRKNLWMIRPMVFAPEKDVKKAALKHNMPITKSKCPADGHTSRQNMKEFLSTYDKDSDAFKYRLFGALRRNGVDGWGYTGKSNRK